MQVTRTIKQALKSTDWWSVGFIGGIVGGCIIWAIWMVLIIRFMSSI